MENRTKGIDILYNRLRDNRDLIGLRTFKMTPTIPLQIEDLPGLFMVMQSDVIVKSQRRCHTANRELNIVIELITNTDTDINSMYDTLREVLLSDKVLIPNDCRIEELGTLGPQAHGVPNVQGMQLEIKMKYIDFIQN